MDYGAIELRYWPAPGASGLCRIRLPLPAAAGRPPSATCRYSQPSHPCKQEPPVAPLAPTRRGSGGDIAERNEEINKRRLGRGGGLGSGGPLRVTDPAALARLMAEMKAKTDQQR